MLNETTQTAKQVVDYGLGTTAVSSPLWLEFIKDGIGWYMLGAGAVLISLRIALAVREWRRGEK